LPLALFENAFQNPVVSRRRFLQFGVALAAAMSPSVPVMAAVDAHAAPERHLAFYNTHTGERLKVCYFSRGRYEVSALQKIDYILRDHRCNEIKSISHDLLDLLHAMSQTIGGSRPFHVISGYRSPKTNEKLRQRSRKVASGSLHIKGMAIDIRVPGFDTVRLCGLARLLKRGGVGYYSKSDFVHVDVGRVRYW
jgi:uncharacterized protein YcbK (DUF882 family)